MFLTTLFEPQDLGATFRINYNSRIDSWILDIPNEVEGIRIVGGVDLLGQFKHLNVPQGELRIFDLDGLNREPTRDLFGDRVILTYTDP